MNDGAIQVIPVRGIPRVREGDDLPSLIIEALQSSDLRLVDSDVVVVTQKVVSKAEGRVVQVEGIKPGAKARKLAAELRKDPRTVQAVLDESKRIVRKGHGVLIVQTRHGFVCANAGIDQSNVGPGQLSLLPRDPDRSARRIRSALEKSTGRRLAVVITDTFGRPWREGQTDVAIGCSGIEPMVSLMGKQDGYGYRLRVTQPAVVDEIAAASELVMKKLSMVPVSIVRGAEYESGERGVKSMLRKRRNDLFR